jgi:hypothetical protein
VQVAVAVVAGAALLLAPLTTRAVGALRGAAAATAAGTLAALIIGAQRGPVHIGTRRKANVSTAPEVAAVLLLPGPLAVLTLAAGTLLGEAQVRARTVQRLFNAAVAVLKTLAGLLTATAVLHLYRGPAVVAGPAASLAVAAALYGSTVVLVRGMAAVQLREHPLRRAWAPGRDLLVAEVALSLTGILAARAAVHEVWTLVLLAAPAAIAQRALRTGVALEAETRLALEELADIVDLRDHYTFEHSRRVAELVRAVARRLRLHEALVEQITMAGRVHDVGKIGIKSSVLMKPGALTAAEWGRCAPTPRWGRG